LFRKERRDGGGEGRGERNWTRRKGKKRKGKWKRLKNIKSRIF
jgi:hypothetical protein